MRQIQHDDYPRVQARAIDRDSIDAAPRAAQGILIALALSLPVWGGIALVVNGVWNLVR